MPPKDAASSRDTERNEYIPSFIAKKPFYIDSSQDDYLEHQRLQSEKNHDPIATSKWYERGQKGTAATKYRKGACENCGSMTHKAKDCLQRKRKHGAKYTGRDIAADETIEEIKLGWDAKRDRWNGYDPAQYEEVVKEFKDVDAKYDDSQTKQLRMREDTAKYLVNLDAETTYDPKTRTGDDEFVSGDAAEFERAQRYAWETQERGDADKLHLQANPTAGELSRKRKAEEDVAKKEAKRLALLEAYGAQPVAPAIAASNEHFVEYDDRGKVKGLPARKEKSMYPEDVHINNHTSVFGSWWKDFQWGYACCHSTIKNSFCTGVEGMKAIEEAEAFARGEAEKMEDEHSPSRSPGADDRKPTLTAPSKDSSLRRLDELSSGVTDAEMEAYRRNRTAKNDPMANMLGQDVLHAG